MPQYLVIARDGTDEQALDRRKQVRPLHMEGAKNLRAAGNLVIGGAILDENDNMRGSVMILQFETEKEFQEWYATEPYIRKGVWEEIEVKPFRVADV